LRPSRSLFSITGLGSLCLSESPKGRFLWSVVEFFYKFALSQPQATVIFENSDDRALFIADGIVPKRRTALVNGAGIDTEFFVPLKTDNQPPVVVFLARMLKDKGAREFIEAARLLKMRGTLVTMRMVGGVDSENISSLNEAELKAAHDEGVVEYLGHRSDVREVYQQADIACLPSYREGLPKSLIEAASCGLAIVTSDTPGCRQLVDRDIPNGFLVPIKNVSALADAIEEIVSSSELRESFGERSRELALEKYDYSSVLASFDALYSR
jgi:glycosyltransferase involved in cell wall biosynthesis